MMFEAVVLCESKLLRVKRVLLLEAADVHAAMPAAVALADATASCDQEWMDIVCLSAAPLILPLELVGGKLMKPSSFVTTIDTRPRRERRAKQGHHKDSAK